MEGYQLIENPSTHRYIYIGGDTYNKLISSKKYTEDYLLSLPRITTNDKPKSPKVQQVQKSLKSIPFSTPISTPISAPTQNYTLTYKDIPEDVRPQLFSYLPVQHARSINKKTMTLSNTQFEDHIRNVIYKFIIKNFTAYMYNESDGITDFFQDYDTFKSAQLSMIQKLTYHDIQFLNTLMNKIIKNQVCNMDKEGMEAVLVVGFIFVDGKLMTINRNQNIEELTLDIPKTKSNLKPNSRSYVINNFIADHFDLGDYIRFDTYNEEEHPFTSYKNFLVYQQRVVHTLTADDFQFLLLIIGKIKSKMLVQSSYDIFIDWATSGFIFLNGKLVLFHER